MRDSIAQLWLCYELNQYRARHTANTLFILYINRKFISKCYFVYFGGNLFFNAYATVYMCFHTIARKVTNLLLIILIVQAIPAVSVLSMV